MWRAATHLLVGDGAISTPVDIRDIPEREVNRYSLGSIFAQAQSFKTSRCDCSGINEQDDETPSGATRRKACWRVVPKLKKVMIEAGVILAVAAFRRSLQPY
jgi:hypothetical protein